MSTDCHRLEVARVRASFNAAATSYDTVAIVQQAALRRLLRRLDTFSVAPCRVLDVGCGTGRALRPLQKRYPDAALAALDLAPAMLVKARQRVRGRPFDAVCADASALPLADGSADLVFSNLMLQWCNRTGVVFAEFRRILRPGGLVLFSTFGPATLWELRAAWAVADGHTHVSRFIDTHDLSKAVQEAGLVGPVINAEQLTGAYDDLHSLMRALKTMGASNATAGRNRGLTGRARLAAVKAAYERRRHDGQLPATWEVIYGHAWAPGATHGEKT